MSNNSAISFYIPRMLAGTREEDVKNAFATFGNVYRIDFTPQGKKPGFVENVKGEYKSAFVHFINLLEKGLRINIWIRGGEEYKLFPYRNSDEYWLLKPSRSIMQDTMMNNAQIVSNCRALESKVSEQAAKIDEQAATIDDLKKDLAGLQDVVQHLVRGLYCQETQTQCISSHLSSINRHPYRTSRFENPDTHKWDSWPNTRQGDDSERRIEALERQLKELTEFDPALLESEDQSLLYSVSSCDEIPHPNVTVRAKKSAKVIDQAERIETIEKKLEGVHIVVHQLVGGLYHQRDQGATLDHNLNILYPNSKVSDGEDTHKWESWPTTRQGDDCELRIEALEKRLNKQEEEEEIKIIPITLRKTLHYDELFEVDDSDSDMSSITEK